MTITDHYGRALNYLRVAVTDRCNLRCVYCMPAGGVAVKRHDEILRLEEITRVVEAAAGLGFQRIRLTGGEPLVRRGITTLVRSLTALPGIDDIAMTTNATLLDRYANDLAAAGLRRLNISLDSLRPERFNRMSRLGNIDAVWRGIAAAEAAGLAPLKINVVVVRGVNDDELADFAALTLAHPWHVRFIEVMPLESTQDWGDGLPSPAERVVPVTEMIERLEQVGELATDPGPAGNGPARYYRLPGAQGTLGFISPVSEHFCAACNRLRLTADGYLRSCLFADDGVFVRPALREGASLEELQTLILKAGALKPAARPEALSSFVAGRAMSQIGG